MPVSWKLPIAALILLAARPVDAADWKSLKPEGYVSDFAHVIDSESRQQLESYSARVEQATGAQLAFVTVASLEGEPIEDVTNDIFHAWGVGQKKEDNGAMVLLSIGDRKSRFEVGGGLGGVIPDSLAGELLDDMRPALRQSQYGSAMLAAAQRIGGIIAQSKNVTIPAPQIPHPVQPAPQDSAPFPLSLIFIAAFFVIVLIQWFRRRRGYFGGGGPGFWMGGPGFGSGSSGGGFGGFDSGSSGGGFGGFGGGDSGGGGASSDW